MIRLDPLDNGASLADSNESTCNAGDQGSIPGLGRSSGEGNGNPLEYSCLGNPMGSMGSQSQTQLGDFTFFFLSLDYPG